MINERKENARRLVGTQNDAICQICQKTKFADGIGHKCFHCELRSCARCGGRTTHKNKVSLFIHRSLITQLIYRAFGLVQLVKKGKSCSLDPENGSRQISQLRKCLLPFYNINFNLI